jgi:4-hydroxy-tetrahydrodipicolinate synthase
MSNHPSTRKTFRGTVVPMVTPLTPEGDLDEAAVKRIVEHLLAGGVQGIFVLGSTGEGPSVPREMRARLVHHVIDLTGSRALVYAGIFDTIVSESLDAARDYLRRGAAAVVAQLPGYYRLPADAQFRYYANLAERVRGPILLYNIPMAVHMSIDPGVIEHLRAFSNVVGIKDSSGDPELLRHLLDTYADDERFSVLVGATALATLGFENGSDGFVPSIGNLQPALCNRLYQAAMNGDSALMAALQHEIIALQEDLGGTDYLGGHIARLKNRMAQQGLCSPRVLPPLVDAG